MNDDRYMKENDTIGNNIWEEKYYHFLKEYLDFI